MADTEPVSEAGATADEPQSGRRRRWMVPVLGAALVFGEGTGIFLVTRMMYHKPEAAEAHPPTPQEEALAAVETQVELALPEVHAFNKREGRLFMYNLEVTAIVQKDKSEDIKKVLDMRKSTILDRFNTVIRSADSKYLNEPGLDTLRRQFRSELDKILGDDEIIADLLIPKFYQSPADL